MGLRVTHEVHQTLGTAEPRAAKREQSTLSAEWETRWQAWRAALARGLALLTQKQTAATARNIAEQLFALVSDAALGDEFVDVKGYGKLRVTWEQTLIHFGPKSKHQKSAL